MLVAFTGDAYFRYTSHRQTEPDPGYPRKLSSWDERITKLDAAFQSSDRKDVLPHWSKSVRNWRRQFHGQNSWKIKEKITFVFIFLVFCAIFLGVHGFTHVNNQSFQSQMQEEKTEGLATQQSCSYENSF